MYNSSNGILVSFLLVMVDEGTGTVIWPITVLVIFQSVAMSLPVQ
jgi:hypothetical protein